MREIRFRAWIKKDKRMERCIEVNPFYIGDCDRFHWKHEEVELMQYTGVKDYEGKEIYEGDIVQFFNDEDYILKPGKAEVCFNLGAFCMRHFRYGTEALRDMEIDDMFIKVVGNIYENPELLKELK